MSNALDQITKFKPVVWSQIKKYLPNKNPQEHYKIMREYPERQGKYLRPGLILLSSQMFGSDSKKALLTAAAMQVCEDWILVHDDVEDHSLERRHKPALHIIYGEELAVNAGDALHVVMWRMLGDNVRLIGDEPGWKVFNKMADMIEKTVEGQFLEINLIRKNKVEIKEKEYFEMIDVKAGYYTIIGPLQLGAIIAGKNQIELDKIAKWGIYAGRAFQIWDDVMNLAVDSKKQGKEQAGDILEGKRTLILIHTLKNCTKIEKEKIIKIYTKKREQKTETEKEYVLNLMIKYGSIEYAKKRARDYAEHAKIIFDKNTAQIKDIKNKKIIRDLIDFVVNREN